jgi:apolipoprotein N-acyltransferase
MGGAGYYGVSLYWLGHAFLAPDEIYSTKAFFGEAASMLLFVPWWVAAMGFATVVRPLLAAQSSIAAALLWSVSMSIADTLLADIAYQIPLAPIASVLIDTPYDALISGFGILGANFILLAFAACLTCLLLNPSAYAVGALIASTVVPLVAPAPRLLSSPKGQAPVVSVVQPAGEQRIRPTYFDRASWMADLERGVRDAAAVHPSVIVLPELSLPYDPALEMETDDLQALLEAVPQGTALLFGYYSTEFDDETFSSMNRMVGWQQGREVMAYDKAHLVPFGEFVPAPLADLGFPVLTGPSSGLSSGQKIATWTLDTLPPFSVLICYEALLTGAVWRETTDAEWLINATSEVMLRDTLGPYLNLQYTRIRAVETGKPIFRAAATGWTSIIDSDGSILAALPREVAGTLSNVIPDRRLTFFTVAGYYPLYLSWVACLLIIAILGQRARRKVGREYAGRGRLI